MKKQWDKAGPEDILALYHGGLHRWWPAPWIVPGNLLGTLHVAELHCYIRATGNSNIASITAFCSVSVSRCSSVLNVMYNTLHNLKQEVTMVWVTMKKPSQSGIRCSWWKRSICAKAIPATAATCCLNRSQGGSTYCVIILTGKYTALNN